DPLDSTTASEDVGDPEGALERGIAGTKVGFLAEANVEGLDPEVAANLAEASSNLARFDGVRYGPRADESSLLSLYVESRTAGFGPEVKRRILLGTFALSAGYYDAYYGRAMRARQLLLEDFERAFEEVDAIVCPTIPTPAFRLGEKVDDPLTMYLSDIFTVPASLAGLPAISVPSGLSRGGLPLGVQIMARRFNEETLFAAAR